MGRSVCVFRNAANLGAAFDPSRHLIDQDTGEVYGPEPGGDPPASLALSFRMGNAAGMGWLREQVTRATPHLWSLVDSSSGFVLPRQHTQALRGELEGLVADADDEFGDFLREMLAIVEVAEAEGNPIAVF